MTDIPVVWITVGIRSPGTDAYDKAPGQPFTPEEALIEHQLGRAVTRPKRDGRFEILQIKRR